jgi:hypothetical protein
MSVIDKIQKLTPADCALVRFASPGFAGPEGLWVSLEVLYL